MPVQMIGAVSWAWPALRVLAELRSGCKPIPGFVLLQRGLQSNRIAAFKWVPLLPNKRLIPFNLLNFHGVPLFANVLQTVLPRPAVAVR